ncbi:MAG: hypothetical protein ABSG57_07690 [Candidatus Bathyarchaeia archaeon]
MLKVNVGSRNRATLCRRCGRRLGEVAAYGFITHSGRSFCANCGEILQDSTVQVERHVDEKGLCHKTIPQTLSKPGNGQSLPQQGPGKPSISAAFSARATVRQRAGEKGFVCHSEQSLKLGKQAVPHTPAGKGLSPTAFSAAAPREAAPGKPSFPALLPSTIHTLSQNGRLARDE